MTIPAWFASVPYQGIRPRSFAHLRRADAATQPADRGSTKEDSREDRRDRDGLWVPRGSFTGSADADQGKHIQKATQEDLESRAAFGRRPGRMGSRSRIDRKHKSRGHERNSARATTPAM